MAVIPGKGVRPEDLAEPIPGHLHPLAMAVAELRELAANNPSLATEAIEKWQLLVEEVGETNAAHMIYEAKGWL